MTPDRFGHLMPANETETAEVPEQTSLAQTSSAVDGWYDDDCGWGSIASADRTSNRPRSTQTCQKMANGAAPESNQPSVGSPPRTGSLEATYGSG